MKDVATALGDLVQATKAASGKSIHDPAMIHLRDSAKVCCLILSMIYMLIASENSFFYLIVNIIYFEGFIYSFFK